MSSLTHIRAQSPIDHDGSGGGGGPVGPRSFIEKTRYDVYLSDSYTSPVWHLAPGLELLHVTWCAAPQVPTAVLRWRYGDVKYENESTFTTREQVIDQVTGWTTTSWVGKYIVIELFRTNANGTTQFAFPDWLGVIHEIRPFEHGAGLDWPSTTARRPQSGEMLIVAKGVESLLDQSIVDSTIQQYGGGQYYMRSAEPTTFNVRTGDGQTPRGNRAADTILVGATIPLDPIIDNQTETVNTLTYTGADSIYPFASQRDAALWTGKTAARYLVRFPRVPPLRFKIIDPVDALAPLVDVWGVGGMSQYVALQRVIAPNRGLGFFCRATNVRLSPNRPIDVVVFTATDVDIRVGTTILRRNPNTLNLSSLSEDITVEDIAASIDDELRYDVIEVVGDPVEVCGTFSPLDGTLGGDWSDADELRYKKGALGDIDGDSAADLAARSDFFRLPWESQLLSHDARRQSDDFSHVFTRFRFAGGYGGDPKTWPRIGGGEGGYDAVAPAGLRTRYPLPPDSSPDGVTDSRTPWMPRATDDGYLVTGHNMPSAQWGRAWNVTTPLVEGVDYTRCDSSGRPIPMTDPNSGERAYRPPFVLLGIPNGETYADGEPVYMYRYVERLSDQQSLPGFRNAGPPLASAHVRVESGAMAVSVIFPYRHYLAGDSYRVPAGEYTVAGDLSPYVEVLHVSGWNGQSGAGTLELVGIGEPDIGGHYMRWTPPGGGAGPVTLVGGTGINAPVLRNYNVPGADNRKYISVSPKNLTQEAVGYTCTVTMPPFWNAEPSYGYDGKPPMANWRDLLLTASFDSWHRPRVRSVLQSYVGTPKVLRLYAPGAKLQHVHPQTVVDINPTGGLLRVPPSPPVNIPPTHDIHRGWWTVRNDRDRLAAVAAFATAWFGRRRRSLRITYRDLRWPGDIGSIVRNVDGVFDVDGGQCNTPIVSVTLDVQANRTTMETAYYSGIEMVADAAR